MIVDLFQPLFRCKSRIASAAVNWVAESPSSRDPRLFIYICKRFGLRKALGIGIYDSEFYKDNLVAELAYADLASIIKLVIKPSSVCDFGCGNGFIIHYLKQQGVIVKGIESSRHALPYIPSNVRPDVLITTIAKSLDLGKFDLVICTEVAEHIPKVKSAVLIRNLTQHAQKSVFFTAAAPGQWGDGHINCQPKCYWERLFHQEGWCINKDLQQQVLEAIQMSPTVNEHVPWIFRNLMIFTPSQA